MRLPQRTAYILIPSALRGFSTFRLVARRRGQALLDLCLAKYLISGEEPRTSGSTGVVKGLQFLLGVTARHLRDA
jgi:hypothetical protein